MASKVQYISGSVAPTAQIEGLAETEEFLRRLPSAVVLAGLTGAFRAAGRVFLAELDRRTPVRTEELWNDEAFSSFKNAIGGALKAALMSEITLDSNYRGGRIEIGYGNLGYIANYVEYGHRMVGHGKGLRKSQNGPQTPGGFVKPYPFIRPAFDAVRESAIEAFVASIRQTLKNYQSSWAMPAAA